MNSQNSSIIQSANAMVFDYCKRAIGIPISHVLVSRIYEKNLVYKITISDGAVYSVKLFLNRNNPSQRYNLENEILNIQKNCRFHTFRTKDILFSHVLNDNEFYALTIRPWIAGTSTKDILRDSFLTFNTLCLPLIKEACNELWEKTPISDAIPVLSSVFSRNAFNTGLLSKVYPEDIVERFQSMHKQLNPKSQALSLINGDISLHEFLLVENGDMYVIDWEELSIGDPIIDIAGIFYSIFEEQIKKMNLAEMMEYVKKYFEYFSVNRKTDFAYHFLERVAMADYYTHNQNSELITSALLLVDMLLQDDFS